jgi:PKD repeat protein
MLINIYPDKSVLFDADSRLGWTPFDVSFTGSSDLSVDTWTWDFGDGDSAFVQSPSHIYNQAGRYDVTLQINAGGDIRTRTKVDYITALADSMIASNINVTANATAEVTIYGRNVIPVNKILVPVMYDLGDLELSYDSFSTEGCRTDYFEEQGLVQYSPASKKVTFSLQNSTVGTSPDLEPGAGPILKLYFKVSASAQTGQSTSIDLDRNSSYLPKFFTEEFDYEVRTVAGTVNCLTASSAIISLNNVTGLVNDTTISAKREIKFYIRLTNNDPNNIKGISNGFRIYSPDGATWSKSTPKTLGSINWSENFMFFYTIKTNVDGVGADTVGFGGIGSGDSLSIGIPGSFDDTAFCITIGPVDSAYVDRTICIDSCWYPPTGVWKWDGGVGVGYQYPMWDGPYCFTVGYVACCMQPISGNIDYDPGDIVDISDLVYLVDYMFTGGPAPACFEEANVDGSDLLSLDISDLVYLIDYMFSGGPLPAACP